MKFLAALLFLLLPLSLQAQTRVLVGVNTGSSFGNLFVGPVVSLEAPLGKHVELDVLDNYNPIEHHAPLGNGWANLIGTGGILWLTPSLGFNSSFYESEYTVNKARKVGETIAEGFVLRKSIQQMPIRFTFDYLQELNSRISSNGTEADFLKAGRFDIDMRVACHSLFCYRVGFDFEAGHVLTQSNPQCDGTFSGAITCPRTGAIAGAFTGRVSLEFPRHKSIEQEAF